MVAINGSFAPLIPGYDILGAGLPSPTSAASMHLLSLFQGDAFSMGGNSGFAGPQGNPQIQFAANLMLLAGLAAMMQQMNQSQGPGQAGQPGQAPGGAMPGMDMSPADLVWMMIQYFANMMQQAQRGGGGGGCGCSGRMPGGNWGNSRSVNPGSWGGNGGSPTTTRGAGVNGSLPTGNGSVGDFLNAALAQNGDRYVYGAETNLNDANPHTFDCSELVEWASAQAGVRFVDGSSNQRANSIPISVDQALRTPGALLFRNGHVAISLGDGRTIEAKGSRHGVGIFNARGRFTSGGLIPGMNYG